MNELTTKKRIRNQILQCLDLYDNGETISTDYICRQVNKYLPKKVDTGTIKREMRFLRADGIINYKPVGAWKLKTIRIIK